MNHQIISDFDKTLGEILSGIAEESAEKAQTLWESIKQSHASEDTEQQKLVIDQVVKLIQYLKQANAASDVIVALEHILEHANDSLHITEEKNRFYTFLKQP